jgi:hypothetical protein
MGEQASEFSAAWIEAQARRLEEQLAQQLSKESRPCRSCGCPLRPGVVRFADGMRIDSRWCASCEIREDVVERLSEDVPAPFTVGPVAAADALRIELDPRKQEWFGWVYRRYPPGWEDEGPWGDSLAWLQEQARPEPGTPCPRCNWPGAYRWLRLRDRGRKPEGLLTRAHVNSAAARQPILARYLDGSTALDSLDGIGDRRCVECAGIGYVDVDLRPGRHRLGGDEWRGAFESFDDSGRLDFGSYEETPETVASGLSGAEPEVALRATDADPLNGSLFDEQRAACALLEEVRRYVSRPLAAVEPRFVSAADPFLELVPSLVKQRVADVQVRGGGRLDEHRREVFSERDAMIMLSWLFGYSEARIAAALGLSEKQVIDRDIVKALRAEVRFYRDALIHVWHGSGLTVSEIAAAVEAHPKTVQRALKEVPQPEPLARWLALVVAGADGDFREFFSRALFEAAAPRRPSEGGECFYGLPRHVARDEPPYEPYHSWSPLWVDGVLTDGPQRSYVLLSPHLPAVLALV